MAGDWRDARGVLAGGDDKRPDEVIIREARGGVPDDMVLVRRDDLHWACENFDSRYAPEFIRRLRAALEA